jgi:hypothetical protein
MININTPTNKFGTFSGGKGGSSGVGTILDFEATEAISGGDTDQSPTGGGAGAGVAADGKADVVAGNGGKLGSDGINYMNYMSWGGSYGAIYDDQSLPASGANRVALSLDAGWGGGGGPAANTAGVASGSGADGAAPGGGGGGGGAHLNTTAAVTGSGGNGAVGRVTILNFF